MTAYAWYAALAVALGAFWVIGAYQRLSRLHAQVADRYLALDEGLMRYALWVQACLPNGIRTDVYTQPAPLEPLALDPSEEAWVRLKGALEQYVQALARVRRFPRSGGGDVMAALVLAHGTLTAAWGGAMRQRGTGQEPPTERLELRHTRLLSQCVPLRDAYNEAVKTYNGAIAQFPALLLARAFSFRPADNLIRLILES